MTKPAEVTIAGKRYANAAAYIQAILGSIRSVAGTSGADPVEVTVRSNEELEDGEIEALQ